MADSGLSYYPPVGLSYRVNVEGGAADDSCFREASGLSVELGVEEVVEGGQNRFKHRLPGTPSYTNLVLKRGLLVKEMALYKWCKDTLTGDPYTPAIKPKKVEVVLLDEARNPLKIWSLVDAWPVKWSVSDFNSMEAEVVIETLELTYCYFTVDTHG